MDVHEAQVASCIIDFRTTSAGFDQPIEVWLACHERILRMVALLVRLRDHIVAGEARAAARVTAASILRYFDEAAPRHHEDEELDLFPRLLKYSQRAGSGDIASAVEALQQQHQQLDRAWANVRPTLIAVEAGSNIHLNDEATARFVLRYQQHVERENETLTPAFQRAFDRHELDAIGHAMALRRGVSWEELRAST